MRLYQQSQQNQSNAGTFLEMRLRIPGKYWEPQRVASSQTEIAAEILETLGMHKVSAPAVSKAIGIPIGPPFASNLKRNHPSEIKHPTSHTITKNSFAAQPKKHWGMGAAFRNEKGHETGPQGTDLAENRPILIRIGRGFRFRPPWVPGRPQRSKSCSDPAGKRNTN